MSKGKGRPAAKKKKEAEEKHVHPQAASKHHNYLCCTPAIPRKKTHTHTHRKNDVFRVAGRFLTHDRTDVLTETAQEFVASACGISKTAWSAIRLIL